MPVPADWTVCAFGVKKEKQVYFSFFFFLKKKTSLDRFVQFD